MHGIVCRNIGKSYVSLKWRVYDKSWEKEEDLLFIVFPIFVFCILCLYMVEWSIFPSSARLYNSIVYPHSLPCGLQLHTAGEADYSTPLR